MAVKLAAKPVQLIEPQTVEHGLTIDGVIELPANMAAKDFFDGLLDAIIDYVEQHEAFAALGMSHKEYEDTEDNDDWVIE